MKDQAQQPPNANPTARGPGNAIGAIGSPAPGGKDQAQQPPAPASSASLVPYGANAGLDASRAAEGSNFGTRSFQDQGFSGVATSPNGPQPAPSTAASPNASGIIPPRVMDGNGILGSAITGNPGKVGSSPMQPNYLPMAPGEPSTSPAQVPLGNVPPLVGGDALSGAMKDAQQAAYKSATGYLDPQYANSQHDLEAKLANQGIPQGSEAWNRAMDEFNRGKTFAYGQAESNAVNQGNAAQDQLFRQGLAAHGAQFGENLQGAQFSNEVRQQLVNEGFTKEQIDNLEAQHRFDNSMTMRNQDINELLLQQQNPLQMYQALTGGGNVTPPNFTNTPSAGVNNTDLLQAIQQAYGGQLNAYNAQTGSANSSNAAMASIIAAIICDRRLKKNIRMIGMHVVGVPLYEFEYLWGEKAVGVMADELEVVKPEAIVHLPHGYKAVDYARL